MNIYVQRARHKAISITSFSMSVTLPRMPSLSLSLPPPNTVRQQNFAGIGWLRLVGSLKLQVSFAEYSLFYRALLQKRSIILRISF